MPTEKCPECGDKFDRETAKQARNAVFGHMASKVDEDHRGIGYQKAKQLLDISDGVSEMDSTDATGGGAESVSPETPTDSETSGRATTDGGTRMAPPEPEIDEQEPDDVDDTDDPVCPECGETDPVTTVDTLIQKLPETVPKGVVERLRDAEYVCKDCSEATDDGMAAEVW